MRKEALNLVNLVGQVLTNKNVMIRERRPVTAGWKGEISKNKAGVIVIDISPDIVDDNDRLHVLLHEMAHAKHHTYKATDHARKAPATDPRPKLDNWEKRREVTAEKQAAEWESWAEKHAHPELINKIPFEAKLIALLTYNGDKK